MRMKKFLIASVVILSALVLPIRVFADDTVKIGHSVSLTGGASIWGQSEAKAIDLLVKKINAGGGVLGRQIEIIRYDNRAEAVESVNVARRFVGDGVAAVIGPAQSGNALVTGPVLERAKIPMVVTTATNTFVTIDQKTGKVKEYAFRPCFIDPFQGTVAARFAYDRLNARTAAALYDVGSDFSQWVTRYFEEAFTEKGGKVLTKEAFRSEELDYRAQLTKIKEMNPDVVWLPTDQKVASIAARQARELGISVPLLGTDNWGSPDIFDLGGDAIDGSYFVNLTDVSDPDIQDFLAEYRAEYCEEAVLPNPVMAQDALIMIVEGAKKAGSFDGPALVKGLEEIKGIRVTSGILTIEPTNHNPLNKPAVIQKVDVGSKEFAFVEKYQGQ